MCCMFFFRAQARLEVAKEEAQKPGPEKAAKIQNLHKKLRVSDLMCDGTFVEYLMVILPSL